MRMGPIVSYDTVKLFHQKIPPVLVSFDILKINGKDLVVRVA